MTIAPRGPKLAPSPEQLFRQVHPEQYVDGKITEKAFRCTDADKGLLSVSLESKTTARDAYERRVRVRPGSSIGIWAVSVEECSSIQLDAYSDPVGGPDPDPAHGCIDHRHLLATKGDMRLKRKCLLDFAEKRGPIYLPTNTQP
jgi:hypothetical protein